jgi:hypothetical protein
LVLRLSLFLLESAYTSPCEGVLVGECFVERFFLGSAIVGSMLSRSDDENDPKFMCKFPLRLLPIPPFLQYHGGCFRGE